MKKIITEGRKNLKKQRKDEFLIAGIGASEGGIQALTQFFTNVSPKSDIAYMVILHLSPDQDSELSEVLEGIAKIPVTQVTERTEIKPNNIYVLPPNRHLAMSDGYILVLPNLQMEERKAPVDIFFRTLAEEHSHKAIAIILSGSGANGSMGLKRVKERGGVCFVQNPREAEFNDMPRNAIATGFVDEILSVAEIPDKILSYKNNLGTVEIAEDAEQRPEEQQQALREIFMHLRLRTGHDFTNYKRPTLLRRIERRINIRGLADLPAYAKFLEENYDEPVALLKDLLISVTNFFRDAKPYEVIENEILPIIFKDKTSEDQVRIWVAGCATGEEAYSIAMLCAEKTMGAIDAPKIQIFATDIDESSIVHAREGLYTLNDTADVSPERLRRFFNKEGDNYRIRREIRETILFATHNFLKDPPFSHLDMVTCRNVMIYLNQVAQERVVETFHFALNPGGFLFLGTSESVDGASDLYAAYNRENHIFQSRQVSQRAYPIPESTPALYLDKFKQDATRQERKSKILQRISFSDLHQQLLEQYAPPSVVINEEYDILHISERAGKYLQISGGEISQNLLKLVKPELRLEIRSVLYQSLQLQSAVEARGLKVNVEDKTETINIHVRPVLRSGDSAKGLILVIFETVSESNENIHQEIVLSADEPVAKHLEEELVRLKAQLRAANEQHDFQAEEMKASNEELQAMNEELRSAAEELETSKEELQSINEELRTVNQELKVKIEEISIVTNNLQNLINSTDIGTIFLDRSFKVALYTPAACAIFNLIPADHGRSLTDITHKLDYNDLPADAETVLEKLSIVEKEVRTKEGKVYLMRLTPYRTDEDRIIGVVITFVDITQRKKADAALHQTEERLRVTMESAIDYAIIGMDTEGNIQQWNTGAERIFEYTAEEIKGKVIDIIFTEEDRIAGIPQQEMGKARQIGYSEDERWHRRKDGSTFFMSGVMRAVYNPELTGFVKVGRDMTDQKNAHEKMRLFEERYRIALESGHMAAWDWDIKTDKVIWNDMHHTLLGIPVDASEKSSVFFMQFVHPLDKQAVEEALMNAVNTGGIFYAEFRIVRADNHKVQWMEGHGRTVSTENGSAIRMVGVMFDITEQKLFTEELSRMVNERTLELQRSNEDLQHFARVASHDLKEPVRKVRTFNKRILDEYGKDIPEKGRTYISRIESACNRMYQMIEGVLNYSKIDKDDSYQDVVNLNEVISHIAADLEVLIENKKATLQYDNLLSVKGNSTLIYQLFYNLILNALKFSKSDVPSLITVTTENIIQDEKPFVKIVVSDNGIGFEQKYAENIFVTFTRLNSKDAYEGSGLGLAFCKKVVERHKGSITASGEKNKGAVFIILFPA